MRKTRMLSVVIISTTLLYIVMGCASFKTNSEYDIPHSIPWNDSPVIRLATEAGTLRFYFMSGEGMPISNADNDEKWGDSCLVVFPNGHTLLIDTGMSDYAPVLVANLKKMGIWKIDSIVLSHPHDDHIGGFIAQNGILDNFPVGIVYYTGVINGNSSDPYEIEKQLSDHRVPSIILCEGDSFTIGEVKIECISPSKGIAGNLYSTTEDINNSSLVLRFSYKDVTSLFTGDIYAEKERELIQKYPEALDVDILKIPHHGNSTSSCREFAIAVSPKISVATGGLIMHAHIYRNYSQARSRVLFDYLDGYISIVTDGDTIEVQTSRERKTKYYEIYDYRTELE